MESNKVDLYGRQPLKLWDVLKILLAVVLLVYVISKTNFSQILLLRERFSWGWFWITFLLFGVMIAVKSMQYYYLLGKRLPYPRVLEIIVLQNALMNFVATAAGIASYLTILGMEKEVKLGRATVSFVLVKLGDLIAILFFLLLSSFFIGPMPLAAMRIAIIVSALVIFLLAFFFSIIFFRNRFVGFFKVFLHWLKLDQLDITQRGLDYLDAMAGYDQRKIFRLITTAIILSLIYMALTMAWGYARLRMFSLVIGVETVVFVVSLLQIASWIPVYVLGGLGISETLSVYLFGIFGTNQAELAAIMISARLVFYLMNAFSLLYLPVETMVRANRKKRI